MGRLDGKVAVVTGGANGIGRACCERFVEEGAVVVVADVSDDAGKDTVAALERLGGRATYVHTDGASVDDNEAVMGAAVDAFGSLDVLVTAAGITHSGYQSGNLDEELQWISESGMLELEPAQQFIAMPLDD